ncbi:hypothetical protein T069G_01853 [Trichoderma breve]|uniref:Uncharacterized protein n=1 Tax=Trichoderma breve TaxID=2034170 RepID=A0A9W9EEP1_9HYPO|nr:hypothetical protein T069G_01853 [Trichoderma breve]KAJ4865323.1 hypothetical protein T069G_01853 [Trichoderma breve]
MSRVFQITKPVFKYDYQIIPEGEETLYKVKNSPFPRGGTPDLALLDGPDKTAPVLVVCHMPKFSRHFKIGFGDPADPDSIIWEDFIKPKIGGCERRISVSFASDGSICETGQGQREEFTWKRTHHVGVDGKKLHHSRLRNRKLIDERGEVVAIFTFDKTGWLQINLDRGRDFDVMVMVTLLSIIEWMRRQ